MEKIKDWKQVYELPLSYDDYVYAWSKNNVMSLMFAFGMLTRDERKKCIEAINGKSDFKIENLTLDGCDFLKNGEYIFCVRGWGNLTGIGGCNLNNIDALKIQEGFINHVFKALAKNI
jgi:hypothetical protein